MPRLIPPEVVNAIAEDRRKTTAREAEGRRARRRQPSSVWRGVEGAAVRLERLAELLDRNAVAHGVPSDLHPERPPKRA